MNRQLGGKQSVDGSDPLSLLVHAADSQRSNPKGGSQGKPGEHGGRDDHGGRVPHVSLEEIAQRHAAFRAEALHHQGLLSQLRAGTLGGDGADFFQHNAGLVAAQQQQQQAAALALASDIRTAVAAAQFRQAAQYQNHDFLLARTAALQQLGALSGGGFEQLQQELELHKLEEMERRQLIAAATAGGAPMAALAARQQELHEAHLRQEQLDRQLGGAVGTESMLEQARAHGENGIRPSAGDGGGKDSFQKTPGSVVVPCRARGMPMDHNFKTAYFVIPENVEHGEELICSYFACRNAGIKFRYCTHCKVPVAKRNFRKRHKHGKSSSGNDGDDDDDDLGEEEEIVKPTKKAAEPEQKKKVAVSYCQEIPKKVDIPAPAPVLSAKKVKSKKEPRPVSVSNDSIVEASVPPDVQPTRPRISAERETLWAQLLAKRPPTKDGEAVSAWLMEVLSVSDLDTPLKENGQVSPNASNVLPFSTGTGARVAQLAASKSWNKTAAIASKVPDSAQSSASVKRKRPPAVASKNEEDSSDDGTDYPVEKEEGTPSKRDVGSFAEWKDRKKHKSLPKKGFSMQNE